MNHPSDEKLLRYLDEGKRLEELSLTEEEQVRFKELSRLHELLLREHQPLMPSSNFTSRVMNSLRRQPTPSLLTPRNGLWLLAGLVVATGITITVLSGESASLTQNILPAPSLKWTTPLPQLPKPTLDVKQLIQGIIILNSALALFLLDRAVLRPFFQRRADRLS